MAKYCAHCGKTLADGIELCPACGGPATEDGAALFTRMTAQTEEWKTPEEKKVRMPRTRSQKQLMAYIAAAVTVVVLAVLLILYIQPSNRVLRALRAEDYDRALELYWGNTRLAAGSEDAVIQKAAKQSAEQVVDAFSRHALSPDAAASALGKLGALGAGAEELLAPEFEAFRTYNLSQENLAAAETLTQSGEYLAAREKYLLVVEGDSAYEEAQEQARVSLERYAEGVLREADVYIQAKDYGAALQSMQNAKRILLSYDVYYEKLDFKLQATYDLYEKSALDAAAAQAEKLNYTAAANTLRLAMERFHYETDTMREAMETYDELAQDKALNDTTAQADALYTQGLYADAFAVLDALKKEQENTGETEAVRAVEAMEQRFTEDQILSARQTFAGKRENLPEAVAKLRAALRIRDLPEIERYMEELSTWLPVSLAEMEYVDKQGTIFRSASTFEGLDGVDYDTGWVWGEDGAELTFVLNGVYDMLDGTLAVRREDETEAGGRFAILCDGEPVYESETLVHPTEESIQVHVSISGCQRLTLRFVNDYSVRTADNGYCYHGLCGPTVKRYLEGEQTAADTRTEAAADGAEAAAAADGAEAGTETAEAEAGN